MKKILLCRVMVWDSAIVFTFEKFHINATPFCLLVCLFVVVFLFFFLSLTFRLHTTISFSGTMSSLQGKVLVTSPSQVTESAQMKN